VSEAGSPFELEGEGFPRTELGRRVTVELFEINAEKGHGSPSKNRTTKTPHLSGKLQVMGEAGGGLPENSPCHTELAGAGEISPPAFAAPYLQSLSRTLFVFCFWRDSHGLRHPFQRAKLLRFSFIRNRFLSPLLSFSGSGGCFQKIVQTERRIPWKTFVTREKRL
jgi:hypothetical protein